MYFIVLDLQNNYRMKLLNVMKSTLKNIQLINCIVNNIIFQSVKLIFVGYH